jgi:hypothetical protein
MPPVSRSMAVSQGWSELIGLGFDGKDKILQNKTTLRPQM